MLATGFLSLSGGEERGEACQPLLAAGQQIARSERCGELMEAFGRGALDEGVSTLLEVDALLAHPVGQPVVLIEADPGGERKIGTNADKHSSPLAVVDVEIVLNDPPVGDLKIPSVCFVVADCSQDARWLACFKDDNDSIGVRPFEIRSDKIVATALRSLDDRDLPLD